ncbi:cytochrome c oxidase accessory protein CcoG [Sulfuricurvum kujiense DSM 16994]|uniref:Cytochrome c oxidase accessory protein CcoG n=1 Tax=Sulfuricurvum kujiense (strain ATCC BAA-921 / DSM 16994 / JCM 11577 / YK-1) TaxID=709032 RepID=E4TWA4_SULKY|nr:cytochrome c oxidase accessory protein CcoG [Sulfuricurvum kujiense]ADR32720.1 cytochrome c oxidase accessory protein CcoG [Sulfuricurvum kujiense DSM 16994]
MSNETTPTGKEYLSGWTPWRIKRYWFYGLVTIISLVIPWITINGNHLFLLSFDKLKLHLMFVQFDMQELYLMPFLLMILFIGIFGITVLGGRVFCGWICPQTIFRVVYRDLIETKLLGLRKRIKNKQQEPDYSKPENKLKRLVAILLWTGLAFIAASDLMWYFVPPEDFLAYIQNPAEHTVLIGSILGIVAFLVYDVIFLKENFCVYVCPYSRIQSVLYDDDTVMAIYNPNRGGDIYNEHKEKIFTKQNDLLSVNPKAECTTCESCVTVCPTHIDIRKGLQLECINCLECVDACTEVMGKLGKPSLVEWSSEKETLFMKGKTQYFRPKILGYITVLVVVSIILAMMGSKKEYMLLNINKENRLYSIHNDDGKVKVENAYTFLLQNTLNEDHDYYFDVVAPAGMEGKIKIEEPEEAFTVKPGVVKKKVVVLYTDEILVNDERKDTVIPITINAYAVDAKDKVAVTRQSTFTFPRADLLKEEED